MAANDRKSPARPQMLTKSATTSWLRLGDHQLVPDRPKGTCGLKGWLPCPPQGMDMHKVRSDPSPIAKRIGMFEKLSRRRNDENIVVLKSAPPCTKAKMKDYKDRVHNSIHPLYPSCRIPSGNEQASHTTEHPSRASTPYTPTIDRQGLRQRAAAVRERLSSISSSSSSCNTIQNGSFVSKSRYKAGCAGSSDCIALLSPESIESASSSRYLQPAGKNACESTNRAATLQKNPPPTGHVRLGSGIWFRRRLSRSDQPVLARAQCVLEQPQPIRGGEVKRLASLCMEKVSGRLFRGSE